MHFACVMELADVPDSKSGGSDTVRVQLPPSAPVKGIALLLQSLARTSNVRARDFVYRLAFREPWRNVEIWTRLTATQ